MKDVTGTEIEAGDIMLEVGSWICLHVAFNGFTAQYVRTIMPNQSYYGGVNNPDGYKSRSKPKNLIILSTEQIETYIESQLEKLEASFVNQVNAPMIPDERINLVRDSYNTLKEISRRLKNGKDITELLNNIK